MILNSAGGNNVCTMRRNSAKNRHEGSSKGSKKRVDRTCSRTEMTIRD